MKILTAILMLLLSNGFLGCESESEKAVNKQKLINYLLEQNDNLSKKYLKILQQSNTDSLYVLRGVPIDTIQQAIYRRQMDSLQDEMAKIERQLDSLQVPERVENKIQK